MIRRTPLVAYYFQNALKIKWTLCVPSHLLYININTIIKRALELQNQLFERLDVCILFLFVAVLVAQLCLTLCNPMDRSPPVFLPGKSHGQRSLKGYSPQGCKSQARLRD